jgi:NAD(P)-dependent dehydrogenase (short-subunit alcohol dehydrogenase family)
MHLAGKTALVTGASRGIGREIALELARHGAMVAVHYGQRREGAEETARMIAEQGGKAFVLGGDIADLAQIDAMLADLDKGLAQWGRNELDILVNNAGIGGGGSIRDVTTDKLDALISTNVRGLFLLTQRAIGRIPDGGRVINITSMVGLAAYPGSIAYALTKAAQNSFTKSLAVELGPRQITVNAVAPGATDTDFIAALMAVPELVTFYSEKVPLKRIGRPDDIAPVVAFLASDQGRWITGQVIEASGGMHLE